ncbi:DUF1559 domain-containing protein [Fimbriiglobus ruber]|uniref:DUF1559 family PulG-like putative transporter n=1 Tax=Fimbriiglobus ruber TaxID=1908690 RepID=UPI001EE6FF6D|nr:DUF1559 domain-containing protein [Fimbriiglobus ruber]
MNYGPSRSRRHEFNTSDAIGFASFFIVVAVVLVLFLRSAQVEVYEPSKRAHSSDKIKIILPGLHGYHDSSSQLPMPFLAPPGGHPPPIEPSSRLSWRVALLPYIEQNKRYKQFKLDEAWDGPTNGPVARITLPEFNDRAWPSTDPNNQTPYRVFVGGGAIFDERKKMTFSDVGDGTSNTIMLIGATQTVPWAQYNELPFAPNAPLPPLGVPRRDWIPVGMVDGSVRMANKSIDPQVLKAAITANGGESLPEDWYWPWKRDPYTTGK